MKNKMLDLIELAIKDKNKVKSLENIYELYDQLQYDENIQEMASSLCDWLTSKYNIQNIQFSLFDLNMNLSSMVLQKGEEFFLDGEHSFYFIINTHTDLNAIVSFSASGEEHYTTINNDYAFIEAAFFQISPILQNGVVKKQHVEASSIDSVTNVHNRQYLINQITKVISLSKNNKKDIAFLMVGIDRFKAVIEEFDFDIGDQVLIELAKVIHSNIKDFDIVSRLTGDEFLVALVNPSSISIVEETAKKIIHDFSLVEVTVNKETNQKLRKTICIGISLFPQDAEDITQVLKNADNFLNEAKNKGRSQYSFFKKEEESSIDLF
jgi:diguanylate cyclase (GGDEF)-like protein